MQTDAVLELIREVAADKIRPRFRALEADEIDEKRPGDYVTAADREAEVVITAALRADDPGCLVVGEEASFTDKALPSRLAGAERGWVVDPVDGTRNFVEGKPGYGVMVAETRFGEPVRAWIFQPETDHAWVAESGAGTFRDGERVNRPEPNPADLIGAASRRPPVGTRTPHVPAGVQPTSWSCAVDYPRLAEGELDFLAYHHLNPWDHLPGTLLVREAGGVVRTLDAREYSAASPGPGILGAADAATWDAIYREVFDAQGGFPGLR